MGIQSRAFSGVKLTGKDARKFKDQVAYGRPKLAAMETVKRGQAMADSLNKDGYIVFRDRDAKVTAKRK